MTILLSFPKKKETAQLVCSFTYFLYYLITIVNKSTENKVTFQEY